MGLLRERDLVLMAQRGDERAFRSLLEQHHALIYTVVRGIVRDASEAEDVEQEVFVKIYRGLPEFRGSARLSTWIYRIARNEALNAVARRRPEQVSLEEATEARSGDADPEETMTRAQEVERLDACMARLEEPQRLALDLFYRGGKSYDEIAGMLDIPIGTVKTHIHRGKVALRRMMSRGAIPREGGGDA